MTPRPYVLDLTVKPVAERRGREACGYYREYKGNILRQTARRVTREEFVVFYWDRWLDPDHYVVDVRYSILDGGEVREVTREEFQRRASELGIGVNDWERPTLLYPDRRNDSKWDPAVVPRRRPKQ